MADTDKKLPLAPFLHPVVQPLPTTGVEQNAYAAMLNGPGVNQLSLLNAKTKVATVDDITGVATFTKGDVKVFIDQYDQLTGALRISTHKLLDICTILLTKQNDYRSDRAPKTLVTISLDDYMGLCGTPMTKVSKDKTRRRVKEDLEVLYNISMEWTERSGHQTRDYEKMRLISRQGIKSGQIIVDFSPQMAGYLTHAYVMQYPTELLRVDERNPASYYLGKKLLSHHSMDNNQRRGTAHIIGVKTLLDCCVDVIPSYEQVMSGDRHTTQKIIVPFENALDALASKGIIRWHYCNAKYEPLTEEQLAAIEYHTFSKLFICFEALGAPDPSERLALKDAGNARGRRPLKPRPKGPAPLETRP